MGTLMTLFHQERIKVKRLIQFTALKIDQSLSLLTRTEVVSEKICT